jgi:hypothetical protein
MSINCELGWFRNKTKYFLCNESQFLSGLKTAQAVDPIPLLAHESDHFYVRASQLFRKEILKIQTYIQIMTMKIFL